MSTAAPSQSKNRYEVPRPQGKCIVCGQEIPPGEKFIAAVRETPTGLERLDISLSCWEGFDRKDLLGFWQTIMPHGQEKKKVFVDDEVLCTLFERLAEATEPAKINFRFVLGLILMRKRLIVYEGGRDVDGRGVWLVRMKGKDQTLALIDPRLSEDEMMQVSQQLGEILNEEL